MESGLTGPESVVLRAAGEVKRAAAPWSVRGRVGTPLRRSSSHTGVRVRRAGTLNPALHMSRNTVSVSCTPPGGGKKENEENSLD